MQKEYNNTQKKNLIDLTVELYGSPIYVFKLIEDNPIYNSVDSIIPFGATITYDDSLVFLSKEVDQTAEIKTTKTITVQENQTLLDMALQLYGSVTGVINILNDNPTVDNINNNSLTGLKMVYTEQKIAETEFYKKNKISISNKLGRNVSIGIRCFDDSFDLSFN